MTYKSLLIKGFVWLLGVMPVCAAIAQDSTRITIQEAQQLFTHNNLQLLAEKYNIRIASALVMQQKLYNNPTLQLSSALYNPEQKKILDMSSTGQYDISFQQLITLAGKRNKRIRLAEISSSQAENSFYDLLRTLSFSLRSTFYNIYYLQNAVRAYNSQLEVLQQLNNTYAVLQQNGSVTLKDAVRIKSLLYSLLSEQAAVINQLNDAEADLQLLLQNNNTYYIPQISGNVSTKITGSLQLQALLDTAAANRADLQLAGNTLLYNRENYQLQKKLRIPDLNLGAEFDKRGSYVNNASLLNMSIDLPFFNRNQGNIRAAKLQLEQSQVQLDLQKKIVANEVQKAFTRLLNTDKILQSFDPGFRNQFDKLMTGVTDNFIKKNISIIDFTDFVESYKNNMLQLNQLENDRMQAIQALNFATGKTIID